MEVGAPTGGKHLKSEEAGAFFQVLTDGTLASIEEDIALRLRACGRRRDRLAVAVVDDRSRVE